MEHFARKHILESTWKKLPQKIIQRLDIGYSSDIQTTAGANNYTWRLDIIQKSLWIL